MYVCTCGGEGIGCLCTFVLCEHVLYLNRLLANEVFAVQHVDEV